MPDGYWWAELESNVTITAEYIMLFHFLGMVDKVRERKLANYILSKQTFEGYWTLWYNGPGDLSTTIEAYFALKLAGYSAEHPAMVKAREFIHANGGIIKARVFTKIFLALFGEFAWFGVPSMPIELMLLPDWAYFNMYELSSWSRATIIPLSVVMAERPVRKLPPGPGSRNCTSVPPADRLHLLQGRRHPDLEELLRRRRSLAEGLRVQPDQAFPEKGHGHR